MSTYDEVVQILRETFLWPVGISPAPDPVNLQLQVETANQIANTLDAFCYSAGTVPPYGYPGSAYEWYRYACFYERVEFWVLNTAVALGQQHETPVPTVPEAKTVSEWYNQQDHNWTRKGDNKLWNPDDANSLAWHEKLFAAALVVPPEWTVGTDPMIYVLACREGYIQPQMSGFHAAYASQTPRYADVRGLTCQQWIDNLRASDRGQPRPWPPTQPAHPVIP